MFRFDLNPKVYKAKGADRLLIGSEIRFNLWQNTWHITLGAANWVFVLMCILRIPPKLY
jgi:hypothetical protein